MAGLDSRKWQKILISPLFGLGDTILTTPAIKILRETFAQSKIHLFTFKKSIFELMKSDPHLDQVIYYPLLEESKLRSIFYVFRRISFQYDLTINFFPSNRISYNLFAFLTFSKKRIGHDYLHSNFTQMNFLKNDRIKEDENLHCVEENVKLLSLLGIDTNDVRITNPTVYLDDEEVQKGATFVNNGHKKRIGIHPGCSSFKNHVRRRWPKEYFLEVINHLDNYHFYVFAGDEEKQEALFLAQNCKHANCTPVINKRIREVASIIKNLDLFLSNDSGLMHLSAAVGTKTIGIFGPTNPVWVRPWGSNNSFLQSTLDCAPCFFYSPRPLICPKKEPFLCLKSIKPEVVIAKIEEVL